MKCRSAAVSCRTEVCYPFCRKHGRHQAVKRREFITLLGGAAAAWPLAARAQQSSMPVVGFLRSGSPRPYAGSTARVPPGTGRTGFVEGRDVTLEYRWAEGHNERLPAMAMDLVRRDVSIIVVGGVAHQERWRLRRRPQQSQSFFLSVLTQSKLVSSPASPGPAAT